MAKSKTYGWFIFLLSFFICNVALGGDGNKRNNVTDTLKSYLFVKEATGNNDGYWVEKFIESTGLNPKGKYPWCAAYITYGYKVNDLDVPKYPARASSWFDKEHAVPNKIAQIGDLGSLYYRKLGRIGHIVAYLKPFDTPGAYVVTGEGNTNAQGSPEGNRAAKRYRLKKTIHSSADWISPKTKTCPFHKCIIR